MTGRLLLGVPSKGRLQDNALEFLSRAGLKVTRSRGERGYRGTVQGLPGVEVAFLSASEIARELAGGRIHFGLTGLDLLEETVDDPAERAARIHLVTPLGFGPAEVVVAVPDVWIDVATMADLADVAEDFRARHDRPLRVATKFVNLTRRRFAREGILDYRIVESLGATEGAPAAGTAEVIVDITTTGATLAANRLRVLDDGVILSSEAHFVAALSAEWDGPREALALTVLDRIAAELRASAILEIRAVVPDPAAVASAAGERFACAVPFGAAAAPLVLHCPKKAANECAAWLKSRGADTVVLAPVADVYEPENPLAGAFLARLEGRSRAAATGGGERPGRYGGDFPAS